MNKSLLEQGAGGVDGSEDTVLKEGSETEAGADSSAELEQDNSAEGGSEDSGEESAEAEAAPGDGPKFLIPGPDASPEERAEFFKAMGVPEEDSGYSVPEAMAELEDAVSDSFKGKARELGLTPEQFEGVCDWAAKQAAELGEAAQETESEIDQKEQLKLFQQEHGKKSSEMLNNAMNAALEMGGPEFVEALGPAGNNAIVLNAFARLAPQVTEGKLKGPKKGKSGVYTREELRKMQQDPRFSDPAKRDEAYVKKVRAGYEKLNEQRG